ncbi:MAG TPA: RDD family protein, partial [Candidatus Baltobacteraceae bacterium]|nr:RDD family protein [Candidatus Baltobacteraceae bacterium]
MERSIDIATGESVAFNYELAGVGSRFFAVFIDMTIQIAIALAVFIGLVYLGTTLPEAKRVEPLTKAESAILLALLFVAIFLLFFGYFIIFEWLWAGRTPGKRLLGIRVVREGGVPLDFTSSVIRNCVRILEFAFGFYAFSAVSALLSPRNQRLGDLAAGTLVVRDQPYERTRSLAQSRAESDDPVVRELSPAERDLVRRFVERREALTRDARKALAAQIAATVRP